MTVDAPFKNDTTKRYFIDLFAGCGGLSLGLERAGFVPVFVNEISPDAYKTKKFSQKEARVRDHGYLFKIRPDNVGLLFPYPVRYELSSEA